MVGWHLLFAIRRATARGKYGREPNAASWLPYTSDNPGGKWYWRISFAVESSKIAAERKGKCKNGTLQSD